MKQWRPSAFEPANCQSPVPRKAKWVAYEANSIYMVVFNYTPRSGSFLHSVSQCTTSPFLFLGLRPGRARGRRPLQPSSAPRNVSQPLLGRKKAGTEFIRRACSQERCYLFNIPCGLSSHWLWQEPYLDFCRKHILPSALETGAITFKRFRRKTNYMAQRLPEKHII